VSELKVGDKVLHTLKNKSPSDKAGRKREPMSWPAVVEAVHGASYTVRFENGKTKVVRPESVKKID
jgi:hypothetical protein